MRFMKKFLRFLLTTWLMIMALQALVFASAFGVVEVDNLNVRSESNTNSAIITRFNTGQAVEILGAENDFFVIEVDGIRAFISTDFVEIVRIYATVSGNGVNIRDNPSLEAVILDRFSQGTNITALGIVDNWVEIEHNGSLAYISKDFVSGGFIGELRQASASTPPIVQEVLVPAAPVQTSQGVSANQPPVIQSSDAPRAVVSTFTGSGLRLRSGPSTYTDIITLVPGGTTVDVLHRTPEWARVTFDGYIGYLSREFVQIHYGSGPIDTSTLAGQIIAHGKQFLGTPYLWAGNDLRVGVDCSGFVHHVFRDFGIILYRNSAAMTRNGVPVGRYELLPGDLVFFDTVGNGGISHIGLYIGNGDFIHSSSSRRTWGVVISSLYEPYYIRTYMTARRVL
ncbi:MAG: SH3 domain-containing protein [Defluviitaleaceae bacterium]|nr:SH3 domain-containing protein [Defluviitaleaceae bacterium]